MNISVEEVHSNWLNEYERLAWSYCESVYGDKPCSCVIARFIDDEVPQDGDNFGDLQLEIVTTFKMPCSADRLFKDMAKFSKMSLCSIGCKGLTERQGGSLKKNAFFLNSLLRAAYPRNPKTMTFKGEIGPDSVLQLDELPEEKKPFCAFCGLGVLLLSEARKSLNSIATDEAILDLTDGMILGIIEGGSN